jgi:MFS family permease
LTSAPPLFTRPFVFICLATGCFYLSFYLILPVMPLYVASLGGTPTELGLIIGNFAAMAMLLRPPAGWLIDTRGPHPILLIGMAIFLLASLGYIAARSVQPILALRLFHGVGMGLFPTAATVVIAELAPPARRGEAMGWFGIANGAGLLIGPTVGPPIANLLGFSGLFLAAAGVAGVGLLGILLVGLPAKPRRDIRFPRLPDLFSRAALLPSAILFFLFVPYGLVVAFIPIMAQSRGLANPGFFYTAFGTAMLLVRAKAGQVSDRRGRAAVILPGMAVTAVSMIILAAASGPAGVLVGAALFGLGFGSVQPALMALAADRAGPAERGKAMGTLYFAWELGIAGSAAVSGWLLNFIGFSTLFALISVTPVLGAALALRCRMPESNPPT